MRIKGIKKCYLTRRQEVSEGKEPTHDRDATHSKIRNNTQEADMRFTH